MACADVVPARDQRLPELDGFRGCAILAIVFLHYIVHHLQAEPGTLQAYVQKYFSYLWLGVDAFFVLSGYLIGGILFDHRASRNLFAVFYGRRALRILPAYMVLMVSWLAVKANLTMPGLDWLLEPAYPVWPYFAYVQNFLMVAERATGPNFVAATWSLAIEEQFYLLFPLLVRIVRPGVMLPVLGAGVVVAPVLRVWLGVVGPEWDLAQVLLLPSRWDGLLLGAGVAFLVRQPELRARTDEYRRPLLALLIATGFGVALQPLVPRGHSIEVWVIVDSGRYLVIALFFALVLLHLHLGWLPRVTRLLSGRALTHIGLISYAIYLFHTPMLGIAFSLVLGKAPSLAGPADAAVTLIAFAATVAAAQATWVLFERRLIRVGHRLKYDRIMGNRA